MDTTSIVNHNIVKVDFTPIKRNFTFQEKLSYALGIVEFLDTIIGHGGKKWIPNKLFKVIDDNTILIWIKSYPVFNYLTRNKMTILELNDSRYYMEQEFRQYLDEKLHNSVYVRKFGALPKITEYSIVVPLQVHDTDTLKIVDSSVIKTLLEVVDKDNIRLSEDSSKITFNPSYYAHYAMTIIDNNSLEYIC